MPKIKANGLTLNYDQQGSGEPLILIPYISADNACYAFQVAEYAKHFTCISLDLRGAGESEESAGAYSTETLGEDVAAFMQALGIARAHVAGLSLGAAIGMWLAAKHPEKVHSLSLHGAWPKTDAFLRPIVESWQLVAKALNSVPEMVIRAIFPWCLTPELYAAKPEYIEALAGFVRSRPAQSVESFQKQSNAVMAHDVSAHMSKIQAPTLITLGRSDQITSMRFADPMRASIRSSELIVFEGCSHAALYEKVEEFNQRTLRFLLGHGAAGTARIAAS
jgi:pimeloyl-ACP methyl ester carboxylesterase